MKIITIMISMIFTTIIVAGEIQSFTCHKAQLDAREFTIKTWEHHIGNSCFDIIESIEEVIPLRINKAELFFGSDNEYSTCFKESLITYYRLFQEELTGNCTEHLSESQNNGIDKGYDFCKELLLKNQYTGIDFELPPIYINNIKQIFRGVKIYNSDEWNMILQHSTTQGFITGCSKAESDFINGGLK